MASRDAADGQPTQAVSRFLFFETAAKPPANKSFGENS